MVGSISCDRERLHAIRAVLDHPKVHMRSAPIVAILALVLLVGCGLVDTPATPTPAPTPTAAPRPTAEPPAAVSGWYLAAIDEGDIQIRADLTGPEADALTSAFARRYPKVSLQWMRGSDEQLLQTTLREPAGGPPAWDIYIGHSGPTLKTARLAERWTPPEARTLPTGLADDEGAWYAVAVTYHVLEYNTELIPPAQRPTTYEALNDPRYVGAIAAPSEDLTWLRGLVEARGREATIQLLQPLAALAVRPVPDARSLSALVTAGQQAIGIDIPLDAVERDRRGGGKAGWVGVEPVVTQPVAMVMAANSARPNAARLFANFMLSPDSQVALALAGRVPARQEVDPEPQTLVRGIQTRLTLPPQGAVERDMRALWNEIWGRR